jgi:hypothetical protein
MMSIEGQSNADRDAFNDLNVEHTEPFRPVCVKEKFEVVAGSCDDKFSVGKVKTFASAFFDGSFVVESDICLSLIRPSPLTFTSSLEEDGGVYCRDNFISTSTTSEDRSAPLRDSGMSCKSRESMVSECEDTVRLDSFEIPPEKLLTFFKTVASKVEVLNTVTWTSPWKCVGFK